MFVFDEDPATRVYCEARHRFLFQTSGVCKVSIGADDRLLLLTPTAWNQIKRVNSEVNNSVEWTSDETLWNEIERWDFPKLARGSLREDCDGFSLQKMRLLIEAGIPAGPLTIAVCYTAEGEGHAVLCICTDRGDLILDNRYPRVKTYDEIKAAGYRFLARSVPGMPLNTPWEKIVE